MGTAGHRKHKGIKSVRSSYAYAYVAVMSSGYMVGISISARLSANQRALDAYADDAVTERNSNRRRWPKTMLMLQLSPLVYNACVYTYACVANEDWA